MVAAHPDAVGRGRCIVTGLASFRGEGGRGPSRKAVAAVVAGRRPAEPALVETFFKSFEPHRVAADVARVAVVARQRARAQGAAREDAGVRADGLPALPAQAQGPEEGRRGPDPELSLTLFVIFIGAVSRPGLDVGTRFLLCTRGGSGTRASLLARHALPFAEARDVARLDAPHVEHRRWRHGRRLKGVASCAASVL